MVMPEDDEYGPQTDAESVGNRRLDALTGRTKAVRDQLSGQLKTIDSKKTLDAVLDAPKRFKREWQKSGATGAITKFPIPTIMVFLLLTAYFVTQSGFLDDTQFDDDPENPALNVNGDLEVYLPEGSQVAELIGKVEEDWSTNVMVVYIESSKYNITDQRILQEISYVENILNPYLSDDSDDVIYILSLSTVLKEVNSSAPRIREAIITEVGELGCSSNPEDTCPSRELAENINELAQQTDDRFGGSYEIPSQTTIDLVIGEMYDEETGEPTSGLNKLARDIEGGEDGQPDGLLDRAIMAIAVTENRPAKEIIADTQEVFDAISKLERACRFDANGDPIESEGMCDWEDLGLSMVLTGPVPITNAVTEFSFRLFWEIFPLAVVLVAIGLFVFHSDLLQAGITGMRPIQGFKVVVIAGLPTLCAVFWTLGLIGATNYEVTMTVIIVGPILLALGVSYGLHVMQKKMVRKAKRCAHHLHRQAVQCFFLP